MTHDASYAALVGIAWADTKHDFCIRATGSEREADGVIGALPEEIDHLVRYPMRCNRWPFSGRA